MRGTILVFHPGRTKPEARCIDGPPTLGLLKDAIGGGWLEVVPRWDKITHAGDQHRCVAFCDEQGKLKRLPMNTTATLLWDNCLRRAYGIGCQPDFLVGQIAVVFGDREWMAAL